MERFLCNSTYLRIDPISMLPIPKFRRVSKSANELVGHCIGAEVGHRFIFHQEFLRGKNFQADLEHPKCHDQQMHQTSPV
jgi:hypothetical protein